MPGGAAHRRPGGADRHPVLPDQPSPPRGQLPGPGRRPRPRRGAGDAALLHQDEQRSRGSRAAGPAREPRHGVPSSRGGPRAALRIRRGADCVPLPGPAGRRAAAPARSRDLARLRVSVGGPGGARESGRGYGCEGPGVAAPAQRRSEPVAIELPVPPDGVRRRRDPDGRSADRGLAFAGAPGDQLLRGHAAGVGRQLSPPAAPRERPRRADPGRDRHRGRRDQPRRRGRPRRRCAA